MWRFKNFEHFSMAAKSLVLLSALGMSSLSVAAQDIGSVTYEDTNQKRRVFAFTGTGGGKISVNHYKDGHWRWRFQGPGQNAFVNGDPDTSTYFDPATHSRWIHTFMQGPTGRLWSNNWNGEKAEWEWQSHSNPGGLSGTTSPVANMVSSPAALSFQDDSDAPEVYAFLLGELVGVVGTDPIDLFRRHLVGTDWSWEHEPAPVGVDRLFGNPGVVSYREGSDPRRIYVFVRGDDGNLHVSFDKGAGWLWRNQGAPPSTTPTGSASAISFPNSAGHQISAYLRGGDGTLRVSYWNGSDWLWANRGKPNASVSVSGSPGTVTYKPSFFGSQTTHTFVRGNNGNLYRYERLGTEDQGQGQWHNHGTPPGTTVAFGSTPEVSTYFTKFGSPRVHAFVKGADGDLYVLHHNGTNWRWRPQGTP